MKGVPRCERRRGGGWGEETSEERREQACWDERRQREGSETKVTARCDKSCLKRSSRCESTGGAVSVAAASLIQSHSEHSD